MVSKGIVHATPHDAVYRDLSSFVAGKLNDHQPYREFILSQHPKKMRFCLTSSVEPRSPIFSYLLRAIYRGNIAILHFPQQHFFQIGRCVWVSKNLLVLPPLAVLRTVLSLFGEKLALFGHPIWLCQSLWNQQGQGCAKMNVS